MTVVLLVALVRVYRLIPPRVRRGWSMGCSTSGGYLAELQSGNVAGLAALRMIAAALNPHLSDAWADPHAGGWDEARPGG
jgi:hypothetical protein